jgi:hypothetical protein
MALDDRDGFKFFDDARENDRRCAHANGCTIAMHQQYKQEESNPQEEGQKTLVLEWSRNKKVLSYNPTYLLFPSLPTTVASVDVTR